MYKQTSPPTGAHGNSVLHFMTLVPAEAYLLDVVGDNLLEMCLSTQLNTCCIAIDELKIHYATTDLEQSE